MSGEPYEKSIYSVASMTAGARVQKVVDPEVAALLDDSDSRFGSDVEDLEEDFVFSANLPEEETEAEFDKQQNVVDELVVNRVESSELKASDLQENITQSLVGEGKKFTQGGGDKINENPRVRRLLDEQFDMVNILYLLVYASYITYGVMSLSQQTLMHLFIRLISNLYMFKCINISNWEITFIICVMDNFEISNFGCYFKFLGPV